MKLLITMMFLATLSVSAQNLRDLKDVMSDMGSAYKSISLSLMTGTINAKVLANSDKLIQLIHESVAITPDTILSLPNIEQKAAKEKYDLELAELSKLAIDFNNALKASDLELSKQILTKMSDSKKQGHKDFK